jgi:histidine triad (HIT) family protein
MQIVYEDDVVIAFKDISPQAPTHILVIPKQRNRMTQLRYATADNKEQLGHMLTSIAQMANDLKLDGYR